MYTLVKNTHLVLAYFALALLLIAIIYTTYSLLSKKSFSKTNKLIALAALIVTHFQFLAGILIYIISPLGISNFSGEAMKNAVTRLYIVEHPLMMLLAIVFITLGFTKSKNAEQDDQKFKRIVLFYSIGLVLILLRIPWDAIL